MFILNKFIKCILKIRYLKICIIIFIIEFYVIILKLDGFGLDIFFFSIFFFLNIKIFLVIISVKKIEIEVLIVL